MAHGCPVAGDLPPGFVLDQDLPPGFTLDEAPAQDANDKLNSGIKDFVTGAAKGAVTSVPTGFIASAGHTAEFLAHPIDTVVGDAKTVGSAAKAGYDYLTNPSSHPIDDLRNWANNLTPSEAGEDVGALLSPGAYGKGAKAINALRKAGEEAVVKGAVGLPSRTRELSARALEDQGIKLEAGQVRADSPVSSSGFGPGNKAANQSAAHEIVTQDTGRIAKGDQGIDRAFLDERFDTLGKHYDEIFKDRSFKISPQTIDDLRSYYAQESSIRPAQAKTASATARSILEAVPENGELNITGEGLQRLRTELQQTARTSSDAAERRGAWEMIQKLDDTIQQNNPQLADVLKRVNPLYRATAALDGAMKSGAIDGGDLSPEKFGSYLRSHPFQGTPAQRQFGEAAENVNLQGRFQGQSTSIKTHGTFYEAAKKALSVAGRTQYVRDIQRRLADRMANTIPEKMTTAQADAIQGDLEAIRAAENSPPASSWGGGNKLPEPPLPVPAPFSSWPVP
jgi:hypothetical protein